jgi:hypothetical protein
MSSLGRVLILIARDSNGTLQVLDSVSEDPEVSFVEQVLAKNHPNPIEALRQRRRLQEQEDEAFADYIENRVSAPSCTFEIREHAGKWFRSRIHLEQYKKSEAEAREVIVNYAFRVFLSDTSQRDFILASAQAQIRILIYVVENTKLSVA